MQISMPPVIPPAMMPFSAWVLDYSHFVVHHATKIVKKTNIIEWWIRIIKWTMIVKPKISPLTLFEPPVGATAAADTFRLFWIWIEFLGPGKSLSSNLGSGSDIFLQITSIKLLELRSSGQQVCQPTHWTVFWVEGFSFGISWDVVVMQVDLSLLTQCTMLINQ